ncbi:hypothetical protein [Mycobacterium sp. SA01]|uniref:hypothetical protein n=1 Tax=Mycobacterium sp. SA01 TaxID=3238820 RepID=UPI00351B464E
MPQHYVFEGQTIGGKATIEIGLLYFSGGFLPTESDQGPVLFQAVPTVAAPRPVFVTEWGNTCSSQGILFPAYTSYYCRLRNDNSSGVRFDLHMLTFTDAARGGSGWNLLSERPVFSADTLRKVKLVVLTDADGKIAGTAFQTDESSAHGLVPGDGQSVHVIDVTDEIATIQDVEQLHTTLETYLTQ